MNGSGRAPPSKEEMDKLTVKDIYENLSYGPAPESDATARQWIAEHDGKFGLFINNEWVHPAGASYRPSVCPGTGEELALTCDGSAEDVDAAVAAARTAFESWSTLSPHVRAKHLYAIARHIQKHHRLLAVVESLDNGKSIRESRDADVPIVARHFYHHAGWAQLMEEELPGYGPLGVVAAITPWNFPLMLLTWKIAPALAMGNTVVLKPASYTRLTALLFAQICVEAGLPPGVVNVVTASGRVGSALADHPDVDKVGFTGSTPVGRLLRRRIAGSGKKISLELGGKSPIIIFDSADVDSAIEGIVDAIFFNTGEVCCAGSRLLIQESIFDTVIRKLKRRMNTWRVGHPLDKCIDSGALADQSQYEGISAYVDGARAEGADVFIPDIEVPQDGWYWPPTLITNVAPTSTCVREEIFGPVVVAMTFRNPEEAVSLANNTMFGLAGSVWSENIALASEVATQIKAGAIWVNAHNIFDAAAGFGGYRESGFGRDGGREGLYEYCKPKWMERPRPELTFPVSEEDIVWNTATPSGPAPVEASSSSVDQSILSVSRVDRTQKLFIGGKQCRPDGRYSRPILDVEGGLISEVSDSNRKDVRDAVRAAKKAAPGWGKRAAHNRAQIAYYVAENLMRRADEFASRIAVQTGRDLESCEDEVRLSIERLFHWAAYADKLGGEVKEVAWYGLTVSTNEPVGVVGIACPDEYPLLGFISLAFPAIVRGNTIVIIPSETAPLCATDLYQVFETSDLAAPGGVVNILTGHRDTIVKTLVEHMDVDAMWYHAASEHSAATCRNIEYAASTNMKRTWVSYGLDRDWSDKAQGQGREFVYHAIEVKNVWLPIGEIEGSSGGY